MAKLYYVGKDMNANYLTHWKYIKREKVNGKWRYYYKDVKTGRDTYVKKPDLKTKVTAAVQDKLGYDEREAAKNAKASYDKAATTAARESAKEDYLRGHIDKDRADGRVHVTPTTISPDYFKWQVQEFTADSARTRARVANEKAEAAVAKYAKTPLGKIENLAAKTAKGREAVKKFAQKTVASVKKAAEKGKAFINTVKALNQARTITKNIKPTTTTVKTKWGTFSKTRRN